MRKGRGIMGKYLGKEKRIQGKRDKRSIWCRQDAIEYAGTKDSVERVSVVRHDCLWMF